MVIFFNRIYDMESALESQIQVLGGYNHVFYVNDITEISIKMLSLQKIFCDDTAGYSDEYFRYGSYRRGCR